MMILYFGLQEIRRFIRFHLSTNWRLVLLCLFGLQPIKLRWVINICFLRVIIIYTYWGLYDDIVLRSTRNTSIYQVSFVHHRKNSAYITNNHHKTFLITKIWINSSCDFSKAIFCCRHWIYYLFRSFYFPDVLKKKRSHRANIERRVSVMGRPIVWAITKTKRC